MSKFSLLVKQVYKQKLKSKPFIFMTIIYMAVIIAISFWPEIKAALFSSETENIAVINKTGMDMEEVFISNSDYKWHLKATLDEQLEKDIKAGDYLAAIQFEEGNALTVQIVSNEPLKLADQESIQNEISRVSQLYSMNQLNLTPEQANHLLNAAPVITSDVLNKESVDGKSTKQKQAGIFASYVIGIIIYSFISTFLSMITTEVASEKGSRALEMLLVSVKPETHFKAKLVGVFSLALTQFVVLFGTVLMVFRFTDGGKKWDILTDMVNELSSNYLLYVIAFLFATIFLYLIIGALFGSLVSKVEEAGQVMMPAIMITLIGFYVMISGIANPDTLLIKVFSYLPFTSGMVMPLRIGATDIAWFEPALSLGLLILTAAVAYFVSITFYKRSVLTYSAGGVIQKIKTVFKVTT